MTRVWTLPALTAIYVAAGFFGLSLAFVNESASAVWPPTGLAVAALLLFGMRVWPAVAVGAFIVNVTTSGHVAASMAIAAANTLEGVVAAWLVARFARGRDAFGRPNDIFRFTGAAMAAPVLAASIGTVSLVAARLAQPAEAGSVWLTWWLGDAVGMLLIAPLVLLWAAPPQGSPRIRRPLEGAALAAVLLGVSFAVFGGSPIGRERYPLEFLIVPVLLWPAFRFGSRETATSAVVVAAVAIEATLRGFGPFVRSTPNESLLLLQGFVGVTTTVMLAVSAEVARRRTVEADMRALNDELERRVGQRTEELTRMHDRLSEAQQVAHIGSWEWDMTSNALWWSDELHRIYGIEHGSVPTYEVFLSLVHSDDRAMIDGAVRQAMADGRPFAFDHRIVRPDGGVRVLHGEGRVARDSDGRPVRMMGIGHDITERRRADAEREQLIREQAARREAEQANRGKDRFLAMLSHELRTPLNAALGWSRLLLQVPNVEERSARAAQAIHRNLLVQSRLVADILDVSRAAAGTLAIEHAPVDIVAVVRAAVETVRGAASARGVSFETTGADDPVIVTGDSQRLEQVVWNLLDNAVKFSPAGAVVNVDVTRQSATVEITVADCGPGIAPVFLPHIFDEFRQADESVTRAHGGLGLGLAIARHIVVRHGGTIAARNRDAGGAEVSVSLPVTAVSA